MTSPKPVIAFKVQLKRKDREPVFHRFSGAYSFSELNTVVSHLWGERPKHLQLDYTDDEGDQVRFTSEAEWDECVRIHLASLAPVLRLTGRRSKDSKERRHKHQEAENNTENMSPTAAATQSDSEEVEEHQDEAPVPSSTKSRGSPLDAAAALFEDVFRRATGACSQPSADATPAASTANTASRANRAAPKVDCDANSAAVDLMSLLYNCNAAEELFRGHTEAFGSVVRRIVNPFAPAEVHLDVDRSILYRDAVTQGNKMIDDKLFDKAEHLLRTALVVFPDNMVLEYNLGCVLSLDNRLDESLDLLLAAKAHGYDDLQQLQCDSDLDNVRKHPRFVEVAPLRPEPVSNAASPMSPQGSMAPLAPLKPLTPVAPLDPLGSSPPAAPVAPIAPANVDPNVMTLLSIFPDMSLDEACAALKAASGNLGRAVNSRLTGV